MEQTALKRPAANSSINEHHKGATMPQYLAPPRRQSVVTRNRQLTARYYYWSELCRRREDDTRRILAEQEFFINDRSIVKALSLEADYLESLIRNRVTKRTLQRQYPSFRWN